MKSGSFDAYLYMDHNGPTTIVLGICGAICLPYKCMRVFTSAALNLSVYLCVVPHYQTSFCSDLEGS